MKLNLPKVYWESEERVNTYRERSPLPEYRRATVGDADVHSDGFRDNCFLSSAVPVACWRDACFDVNSPTL